MIRGKVILFSGVGLFLMLLVCPVFAAEYKLWDFTSAAECDIGGTSDWDKNNQNNADWNGSWDGHSSLHIDFLLPGSPTEEARMQYDFPTPNTVTFATYPYFKAKLTISGVPSGRYINIELRDRLSCCGNSPRVQAYWDLGNGTYILSVDMAQPQDQSTLPPGEGDPSSEWPRGVSFYDVQGSEHVYNPTADTMYQLRLYFDITRMPYAVWSVEYANMKVDIDWIVLTDDCTFGGQDDCTKGGPITSNIAPGFIEEGMHLLLTAPDGSNYQWKKDDINLSSSTRVSGVTSRVLDVNPVESGDSGIYTSVYTWISGPYVPPITAPSLPFSFNVLPEGSLPVAGVIALGILAAATIGLGLGRVGRKKK